MKNVTSKFFLVIIQLIMNLSKIVQTARGLTVVNHVDDKRNSTPMRDFKDEFLKSKFITGCKIVRLANDRSGNKIFVLMSTWNPIVTATINAPDDVEGRAKCAEHIQTAAAKTLYITIDPLLYGTALTDLIKALRDAVGDNEVKHAWNEVNKVLKQIMALVQAKMDISPDLEAIICEYYSFHVKGKGGSHAQVFSGEPGINVGEIDLILPVGPPNCAYDIKLWNADRTAFVRAQASDIATTTIGGLVSGSMQNVSVCIIVHGKKISESQIIAVRVK